MTDAGTAGELPQDAKVIIEILRSMGVEKYEPRVVNQLLEFMYRYITHALSDAQTYSEHANKPAIDIDDVKLAIQSRVNFSFTQPPPREVLLELAKQRNSIPLPEIEPRPGLRLPPDVDTLTAPNYQIATPDERPQTTRK